MLKMSATAQLVGTAVGASLIAVVLSSAVASANPPTNNTHNTEGVQTSGQAQTIHPYGAAVSDQSKSAPGATARVAISAANGGNNNGVGP
jgi:hypothetical protein